MMWGESQKANRQKRNILRSGGAFRSFKLSRQETGFSYPEFSTFVNWVRFPERKETGMKKPLHNISRLRAATLSLRRAGLNASELLVLEQIALNTKGGELRRLSASYIARPLGVSRQWVNAILLRLEKAGLILRFKTGVIRFNLEKLNTFMPRAFKKLRRKASNWLKRKAKLESDNSGMHNKEELRKKEKALPPMARAQALSELAQTYVPPHLRKSGGNFA